VQMVKPGTGRPAVWLWVLMAICAVGLFLFWNHVNALTSIREVQAMLTAGYASLLYIAECDARPRGVDDLFELGVLQLSEDKRNVFMPGWRSGLVTWTNVRRVILRFPETPEGFALRDERTVSEATGEELACLELCGTSQGRGDIRRVNRRIGAMWFRVVNGKPTGEEWLDDLIQDRWSTSGPSADTRSNDGD